eukprot:m.103881 g.103881  ORF g.103881 m.103881 type:complete len:126 (-) comp27523_c0_seq2:176-553(-)
MAAYTTGCVVGAVFPSTLWGSLFTAMEVAQGNRFSPKLLGVNVGFLFAYHAAICPLEALSGRRSALHNGIVAGALGFVGVKERIIGVPFDHVLPRPMYKFRPPMQGAIVYGSIGLFLGLLSAKPL